MKFPKLQVFSAVINYALTEFAQPNLGLIIISWCFYT